MAWTSRVKCPECRGKNDSNRRFCAQCGASLPPRGYDSGPSIAGRIARGFGVLVLVVALLGIAYGIYYSADRYLLTALGSEPIEGEVETVSTTTVFASTTSTTVSRENRVVAGAADRYGTAIGISKLGFPDGAPALVLVPGDDYSEGVGAAPLAVAHKGAVLIVPPDGLTDDLSAEIARLGPEKVFLVGLSRPNKITEQLQDILSDPDVKVLQGDDPSETAALVAQEVAAEVGTVEKVVIVPSDSFADAIAVAPLAAAQGWPILLAGEDGELPRCDHRCHRGPRSHLGSGGGDRRRCEPGRRRAAGGGRQ